MINFIAFFGGGLIMLIGLINLEIKKHKERKQQENRYNYKVVHVPQIEEIPPEIQDKLNAFDAIVETNTKMLYMLDYQYQKETDYLKKQKILTKQADIQLKIANTSEKANKLRDKYNILE